MSDEAFRCTDVHSEMRCELVAGHRSMHAARSGAALFHWRDSAMPAEYADRISLQWAAESAAEV